MEISTDQINLKELDKSDWKTYRFDEIAQSVSERVDPNETDLDIYVGLEHIDPEDIHIRRTGTSDDVKGTKLRFYMGDIIFGRRRAYQRKAVIATVDGFCSAHALVLRANPEVIDPDLFPFFMHSDQFMHRAVDISVGSLSPTINWGTLKTQEFKLPPKDQQAQLAELLWAMDEVIESEKSLQNGVITLRDSIFKKFQLNSENWEKLKLKDLMEFHYGKALKESDRIEGLYPVVSSSGIQGKHKDFLVNGPGIVVGRKGNVGETIWVEQNFWPIDTAYFISIRENYDHIPLKFFFYLIKAADLKKHSIATAVPGLNRDDAIHTNVHLPPDSKIREYLQKFNDLDKTEAEIILRIKFSNTLLESLINKIF